MQGVCCDVTDYEEQQATFEAHVRAYGSLDVVCLNAGIVERGATSHELDVPGRLQGRESMGATVQVVSWTTETIIVTSYWISA